MCDICRMAKLTLLFLLANFSIVLYYVTPKSNNNALTLLVEQRVKIQCTQVHTGRPVEELAKPGTT